MSTLNYAQTAIGIVNKPLSTSFISIIPSGFSGSASINDATSSEYATAAESWIEMECRLQYMQAQVDEAQAALARKHLQQQEFVDKIDRLEEEKLDLERQLFNNTQTLNRTTAELVKEREEKEYLAVCLHDTELALKKTTAVLRATQQTEINLTTEATALVCTGYYKKPEKPKSRPRQQRSTSKPP
jgi:chromosome segregation ATPase